MVVTDISKTLNLIFAFSIIFSMSFKVFSLSGVVNIGEFYTGDRLFLVAVLGGHRGESLDALREVIEKVKYDVEFKKEEISDNGTKTILAGGWFLYLYFFNYFS